MLETGLRPKVLATNNKFTNVVVPFLAVTDKQTNITQQFVFVLNSGIGKFSAHSLPAFGIGIGRETNILVCLFVIAISSYSPSRSSSRFLLSDKFLSSSSLDFSFYSFNFVMYRWTVKCICLRTRLNTWQKRRNEMSPRCQR